MKNSLYCSLFILLILSASCSSIRVVKTEPADNFALSSYQTFAFSDIESAGDIPQSRFFRSQVDALKTAIEKQMARKGLRRVDTQPELMMNIGIKIDEKTQTRQTDIRSDPPNYIGQRRYTWRSREVEVGKYRQGTIDVHLVDPKRNELVWRGIVEGIVPNKPEKLQKQIDEGMEKLFDKL
ncbi:DUF4136 domain-containing protein [Larkinella rosea]|uniref:DUF4136 domain-containing protein n=1 Tax=Larkinella rosea TaxID=2025312 RepID=A0A3P1C0L6_9BACT|nr:DUF4136 domain-containing protein [Larkinella rosea]RRB06951.1 DUF4136 domain-containing protein [Larkinella rosea]